MDQMFVTNPHKEEAIRYPGKLLLFGEYIIIKGGSALAMPLDLYSGQWRWAAPETSREELQQQLPLWAAQLMQWQRTGDLLAPLDLQRFNEELEQGLYFQSSIPRGYGTGSSGALCAALLGRFGQKHEKQLAVLKQQLAQLEGFFHGSSSGIDPLVCYTQQPLLLVPSGDLQPCRLPEALPAATLFLIDTGIARQTEPLVQHFLQCCQDPTFEQHGVAPLILLNEQAIAAFLAGDTTALLETITGISRLQLQYFGPMILEEFRGIWERGLEEGSTYSLKLCGAGGGGFILGLSTDWDATQRELSQYQLIPIIN
ncbi:MAG: mevalonate kinase [Bacteroidota bacterium]